jgi:hydrogenase maturation protease
MESEEGPKRPPSFRTLESNSMSTVILCLGNEFAGDDGIGIRVARVLATLALPPGVALEVRPNLGFGLVDAMAMAERVVLVDAMSTGRAAGTCVVSDAADMAISGAVVPCCHLFGIADVLAVARRLSPDKTIASVQVIGVEGLCFEDCHTGLSDAVRAALPVAVGHVLDVIEAADELRSRARDNCRAWTVRDPTTSEVCEFRL